MKSNARNSDEKIGLGVEWWIDEAEMLQSLVKSKNSELVKVYERMNNLRAMALLLGRIARKSGIKTRNKLELRALEWLDAQPGAWEKFDESIMRLMSPSPVAGGMTQEESINRWNS